MSENTYEAIVIGGGPAGYVAAIRLGQLGVKTLCVERESMGGICLNWGCIPSKALIAAANLANKVRHAEHMGIRVKELSIDVPAMQQWKEGIVKKLTSGVKSLVKGNGGDVVMGEAVVIDANTVRVTDSSGRTENYKASKAILIATGTSVIELPGLKPDGQTIITARDAVSLQEAPKHMVIVGGGIIGLELGMVYQKLGTKIVVVELSDGLLPGVDRDLVRVVEKKLKADGAEIYLKSKASEVRVSKNTAEVTIDTEGKTTRITTDKVLVAVGFRPDTTKLGIDKVGVKLDAKGHIVTNDEMRSSVPSIFAIGDVTGPPYLAHKAFKEGEIAAEVIAGHKSARDWRAMPSAIFTDPEIATVGMSESEAKAQGKNVRIGKMPFAALGRALAVSETDGFIKIIIDAKDNLLLGVAIVGPDASDLISEASLALEMSAYAEDVAWTVHPHPTLSEGMMEAFKHSIGEAVHIMNK